MIPVLRRIKYFDLQNLCASIFYVMEKKDQAYSFEVPLLFIKWLSRLDCSIEWWVRVKWQVSLHMAWRDWDFFL